MDAQPWPGYVWHVLEHFAALARLQLLRMLQRWDLPQPAHVQLLQHLGVVGAIVLSGWAGYVSVRAIWELTELMIYITMKCVVNLRYLIQPAMPWFLVAAASMYLRCLLDSAALRQETFEGTRGGNAGDCPICTETFEDNPWTMATLPCCKQSVCWACLCRHAESVIDDARPDMNCPLFCKVLIPDVMVYKSFRRHQWSWHGLDPLGQKTRRKCRAYERWCLSSGLASTCAARMEDVVHCPGSDCDHMWLLPKHLRRHHHAGKSCLEFDATLPSTLRSKERHWAGAKECPGCGAKAFPMVLAWSFKDVVQQFLAWVDQILWDEILTSVVLILLVCGLTHYKPVADAKGALANGQNTLKNRYLALPYNMMLGVGWSINAVASFLVKRLNEYAWPDLPVAARSVLQLVFQLTYFAIMSICVLRLDAYYHLKRREQELWEKLGRAEDIEIRRFEVELVANNLGDTLTHALAFVYGWGVSDLLNVLYYAFFMGCGSYSKCEYQQVWYFGIIVTVVLGLWGRRWYIKTLSLQEYRSLASKSYRSFMITAMSLTVGWAWMNVCQVTTDSFVNAWNSVRFSIWTKPLCYLFMAIFVYIVMLSRIEATDVRQELRYIKRERDEFHEAYPTVPESGSRVGSFGIGLSSEATLPRDPEVPNDENSGHLARLPAACGEASTRQQVSQRDLIVVKGGVELAIELSPMNGMLQRHALALVRLAEEFGNGKVDVTIGTGFLPPIEKVGNGRISCLACAAAGAWTGVQVVQDGWYLTGGRRLLHEHHRQNSSVDTG
eukprot:s478_g16.t1